MSPEIENWLAPMLEALLMDKRGGEAFARFMETAISSASDRRFTGVPSAELVSTTALADMFAASPDPRIGTIDWVRLGQLIRRELSWDDYPAVPPATI